MGKLRRVRQKILRTLRVKPKNRNPAEKIKTALYKINATQEEATAIIKLAKLAVKRVESRDSMHAKGRFNEDGYNATLINEAEEVLGKHRAEKFFDMCNDPYF